MTLSTLKLLLGELTNDGQHRALYTYGGKGWGGASIGGEGLDCSGFVQGFLRRTGQASYSGKVLNAAGLDQACQVIWNAGEVTSLSRVRPFDLAFFGSSRVSHVGLVLVPGVVVVDMGGGGSGTYPGGSDWPPKAGQLRGIRWGYRKDLLRVGRWSPEFTTSEDSSILAAWEAHVAEVRAGGRPELSSALSKHFRPMWRGYEV